MKETMTKETQVLPQDWDALLESLGTQRPRTLLAVMPKHPPLRLLSGLSEGIHPDPGMRFLRKLPLAAGTKSQYYASAVDEFKKGA